MARLYDNIIAGRLCLAKNLVEAMKPGYAPTAKKALENAIENAAVIVADNVSDFYYEDPKETYDIERDFPNLAPPFPKMWIEYRFSGTINEAGKISHRESHYIGILFTSRRQERGGWCYRAEPFLSQKRAKEPIGPLGGVLIGVSPDGAYRPAARHMRFADGRIGVPCEVANAEQLSELERSAVVDSCLNVIKPALLAISFMHCRNVETREGPRPPIALDKKWRKRYGRPLVRYKVIDIDPMRRVLESEGGASTNGLKKALHICRGHFATYTEDAPLFGRVVGTFWKPQHVRGTASAGAVVKDYNVKAPRTLSPAGAVPSPAPEEEE